MRLFDVYPLIPIEPVRALGSRLWDAAGTEYLANIQSGVNLLQ